MCVCGWKCLRWKVAVKGKLLTPPEKLSSLRCGWGSIFLLRSHSLLSAVSGKESCPWLLLGCRAIFFLHWEYEELMWATWWQAMSTSQSDKELLNLWLLFLFQNCVLWLFLQLSRASRMQYLVFNFSKIGLYPNNIILVIYFPTNVALLIYLFFSIRCSREKRKRQF